MSEIRIGTLYTDVVEIREPGEKTEGGQFEVEVMVTKSEMRASHSPKTFAFRAIGYHLSTAIADSGVPKEFWWIEFSDFAKREWNLPERQKLEI